MFPGTTQPPRRYGTLQINSPCSDKEPFVSNGSLAAGASYLENAVPDFVLSSYAHCTRAVFPLRRGFDHRPGVHRTVDDLGYSKTWNA